MEKETSRLSHDARHKRRAPRMLEGWGQGRLVHERVVQQHLGILRALDLGKTTVDKRFDSRYEVAIVRCRGRIAFPADSSKQPWIRG